jgi:COMPASS component SWD3
VELIGGGTGEPGHSNRIFSVKFDKEEENLLISGGWDRSVKVWDIR